MTESHDVKAIGDLQMLSSSTAIGGVSVRAASILNPSAFDAWCGKKRELVHGGSGAGYQRGCRCEPCRAAHAARTYRRTQERYAYTASHGLPSKVKHGLCAYRNWGCRCAVCFEAASYQNQKRYFERQAA